MAGYWAEAPERREQLVLYARRLDEVVGPEEPVRLLDEILSRLDWSAWEAEYDLTRGRPPIPPRVLAAVILYGLLRRVRSSRLLEEALRVRLDFRWLAEGRQVDHTTLSEFRRRHGPQLHDLFVQVGLTAREAGLLPLEQLGFDGTRFRSDNRRHGSLTPEALRKAKAELAAKFVALERQIAEQDAQDDQRTADAKLPEKLKDVARRQREVERALQELDRLAAAGEPEPARVPLTDPQSRVMPNKEGGFAPNYVPLATVDAHSGLIAACDVIAGMDEDRHLLPQIEQVQRDFDLPAPPPEMLADGLMATGANLQACEERGVVLYSPAKTLDPQKNPALRDDPTQPVADELLDRLPARPTRAKNADGTRRTQFTKDAFVWDEARDCYWCPQGKALHGRTHTRDARNTGPQPRTRYTAAEADCTACPLRQRCLQGQARRRDVSRYEHDPHAERLARRMATKEGKDKYARRRHVAERPFAVIKHVFGARRFLLRGLDKVRTEWRWLALAFNLSRLLNLLRPPRPGPAAAVP